MLITLLGQVEYSRAYYRCDECQQGHYPLDQKLGLRPGQMSAELESLSGVQLPFGQSSQLFEWLRLVSLSDHRVAKATQAMGQKAVTYFTNNRHRMDYPTCRANGYQIGSGTIESGCKQIVTQRLKVAGAIWERSNAVKTAKARAAFLSNQWDLITSRREHLGLPLAA